MGGQLIPANYSRITNLVFEKIFLQEQPENPIKSRGKKGNKTNNYELPTKTLFF